MREFFEYAKRMYERKTRESKQRILETAYAIAICFSEDARKAFFEEQTQTLSVEDLIKEFGNGGQVGT